MTKLEISYFVDEKQHKFDKLFLNNEIKTTFETFCDDYLKGEDKENESKLLEVYLRISQSFINLFNDEEKFVFIEFPSKCNVTNQNLHQLLTLLDAYLNPEMDIFDGNWLKHQNVCKCLVGMLQNFTKETIEPEISELILNYVLKILQNNRIVKTNLWALLVIELLIDRPNFLLNNDELIDSIKSSLQTIANVVDNCSIDKLYNFEISSLNYQLGFCAKWCLKKLDIHLPSPTPYETKIK